MHEVLHPRDNVDRLYVSRKEGRWLASTEDKADTSIQWLEDYTEMCGGRLIKTVRNNTENTRTNRTEIPRNQKLKENQLYRLLSD